MEITWASSMAGIGSGTSSTPSPSFAAPGAFSSPVSLFGASSAAAPAFNTPSPFGASSAAMPTVTPSSAASFGVYSAAMPTSLFGSSAAMPTVTPFKASFGVYSAAMPTSLFGSSSAVPSSSAIFGKAADGKIPPSCQTFPAFSFSATSKTTGAAGTESGTSSTPTPSFGFGQSLFGATSAVAPAYGTANPFGASSAAREACPSAAMPTINPFGFGSSSALPSSSAIFDKAAAADGKLSTPRPTSSAFSFSDTSKTTGAAGIPERSIDTEAEHPYMKHVQNDEVLIWMEGDAGWTAWICQEI